MRWIVFAAIGLLLTAGFGIAVVRDTTYGATTQHGTTTTGTEGPVTVIDEERRVGFEGAEFVPHRLLPPGTTSLSVEATWRDGIADRYDGLELSVRTAASQEPEPIGVLVAGQGITISVSAYDVDRPEQRRSAWSFIVSPVADATIGQSTFVADVHLRVVASGDAEREFPVRSDPAATVLEASGFLATAQHHMETEPLWGGDQGIRMDFVLPDGVRVQDDLRVELELDGHPDLVGHMRLSYMDAGSRHWHPVQPDAVQGDTMVFDITAEAPDADTIPTGQWRFRLEAPDFVASYEPGLGFGTGYVASSFHMVIMQ